MIKYTTEKYLVRSTKSNHFRDIVGCPVLAITYSYFDKFLEL